MCVCVCVCAGWFRSSRSWRGTRAGGNKGEWLQTRPLIPSCFVFGFIWIRSAVYLRIPGTQTQQNMTPSPSPSAWTNPLNCPPRNRRVRKNLRFSNWTLKENFTPSKESTNQKMFNSACADIIAQSDCLTGLYIQCDSHWGNALKDRPSADDWPLKWFEWQHIRMFVCFSSLLSDGLRLDFFFFFVRCCPVATF